MTEVKLYMSKTWLRRQILEQHRSIEDIAKQCGVDRSTVHRWALKFDLIRDSRRRN